MHLGVRRAWGPATSSLHQSAGKTTFSSVTVIAKVEWTSEAPSLVAWRVASTDPRGYFVTGGH
jgi:hypothetical protein